MRLLFILVFLSAIIVTTKGCLPGQYSRLNTRCLSVSVRCGGGGGGPRCSNCPAGFYCPGDRKLYRCGPGWYQDQTGQSGCKLCPAGSYCPGNGHRGLCGIGWFQDQAGQGGCKLCAPGWYQDQAGQTGCKICPAGSYCPGNGHRGLCLAGYFQNLAGQAICLLCPVGKYEERIGSTACVNCPAGTFKNILGGHHANYCQSCPAGTFSPAGSAACTACPVGSAQGSIRSTSCTPCSPGEFTARIGKSECDACPAGTYSYSTGSSACTACPAGSAQGSIRSTSCTSCSPGEFTAVAGQTKCDKCPPGTYQDQFGATGCKPCEPGSYQHATGQPSCPLCPIGFTTIAEGQTECVMQELDIESSSLTIPDEQASFAVVRTGMARFVQDRSMRSKLLSRLWMSSTATLRKLQQRVAPQHGLKASEVEPVVNQLLAICKDKSEKTQDRIIAQRLAVLWSSAPRASDKTQEFANVHTPPPPMLLMRSEYYGKSTTSEEDLDTFQQFFIGEFSTTMSDLASHLKNQCEAALASVTCVCGTSGASCAADLEREVPSRYALLAYCALSSNVVRTPLGTVALARAGRCVAEPEWSQTDPKRLARAVQAVRDLTMQAQLKVSVSTSSEAIIDGPLLLVKVHEQFVDCSTGINMNNSDAQAAWDGSIIRIDMRAENGKKSVVYFRRRNSEDHRSIDLMELLRWDRKDSILHSRDNFGVYLSAFDAALGTNHVDNGCPDVGDTGKELPLVCGIFEPTICTRLNIAVYLSMHNQDATRVMAMGLTKVLSRIGQDSILMDSYGAYSVHHLLSVCRQGPSCPGNLALSLDEMRKAEILDKVDDSNHGLHLTLYDSFQSLSEAIQTNNFALASLLEELEDLDNVRVTQLGTQMVSSFAAIANSQAEDAEGKMEVHALDSKQTQLELNGLLMRVDALWRGFQKEFEGLPNIENALSNTVKEYYDCVQQDQIAQLARDKFKAKVKIVTGTIQVIAAAAAAVSSGGAATPFLVGLASAKSSQAALDLVIKQGSTYVAEKLSTASDIPLLSKVMNITDKTKNQAKIEKGIKSVISKLLEEESLIPADERTTSNVLSLAKDGYNFLQDPDKLFKDKNALMGFGVAALKGLDLAGVPGAGPAVTVLGGIMELSQMSKREGQINSEHEQALATADAQFEELAKIARRIGEFGANLIVEFHSVMLSMSPPEQVSVGDSLPLAIWDDLFESFFGYLESTKAYNDFRRSAGMGRLLSYDLSINHDVPALSLSKVGPSSQVLPDGPTDRDISTMLRVRQTQNQQEDAVSEEMRRTLKGKPKPCGRTGEIGRVGFAQFNEYKSVIRKAVQKGREMHESLREALAVARRATLARLELTQARVSAARWKRTELEVRGALVDTKLSMVTARDAFVRFRETVAYNKPEFNLPYPTVWGARETLVSREKNGVVYRICADSFYRYLDTVSECRLGEKDIFVSSRQSDLLRARSSLGERLNQLANSVSARENAVQYPREAWIRISVGSGAVLQNRFGDDFGPGSVIELDLLNNEDFIAKLDECGSHAELREAVVVTEIHSPSESSSVALETSVKQHGPFIKRDTMGRSHLFVIDTVRIRSPMVKMSEIPSCGDHGGNYIAVKVFGGMFVCIETAQEETDPTPVLSRYSLKLGSHASSLAMEHSELVIYALVSFRNYQSSCPLAQIPEITAQPTEQPTEQPTKQPTSILRQSKESENDVVMTSSSGLGGGEIAAVSSGIFILVSAAFLLLVKGKRGSKEHEDDQNPHLESTPDTDTVNIS